MWRECRVRAASGRSPGVGNCRRQQLRPRASPCKHLFGCLLVALHLKCEREAVSTRLRGSSLGNGMS